MKMKVEESGPADKEKGQFSPEKEESLWNEHKVSTFQKTKEKELLRLKSDRPSKSINPQDYFNYRAREEQIKYELDVRQYCLDILSGSIVEAFIHYGHAMNHLKRRNEYEKKTYTVWLERVKAQENPPPPDILFINRGIHSNQLV
jgi:hypothetical protein